MSNGYHSVVYGPIKSRHLGQSLGINPIPGPRQNCPSPCVYCDTGTPDGEPVISRAGKLPSAGVVVTAAARRIIEMSKGGDKITSITVAGNGDPTLHPRILEITENLRDLRNKWFPKASLNLISRAPSFDSPNLARALSIYDKPIFEFSAGSAKTYTALTRRSGAQYKALVELCTGLSKLVVQAVFVTGGPDNSTEKEIASWIRKLEEIQPREIQITTVPTVRGQKPKPLTAKKLEAIAEQVGEKTGLATSVVASETQQA
jgi:wyosine [tRNA(Phe)-imidazoG37] synthetase (radical SAM superfamily)